MAIKNKKGSHVGIILSFVIFVGFLLFMFIAVGPVTNIEIQKAYTINSLKSFVKNNISEEVVIVNVKNSSSRGVENCLSFLKNEVPLSSAYFTVKDFEGDSTNSLEQSGTIYISWSGESLFKIYFANESFDKTILEGTLNCQVAEVGSVIETEKILERNILEVLEYYETNYTELKQSLNVPLEDEFGIKFKYSNGTILGEDSNQIKEEIYVEELQVNYLDLEATEKRGYLILSIW
ncbi:hypothetical protein HOD29_01975 [archaeon]|jgi:hypothetical protein|nr:hypothetical protein [archaeon]